MAIEVSCRCGQRFAAQPQLYGKRLACPACRRPLRIPAPSSQPVEVTCACGQSFNAQPHLFGQRATCPVCRRPISVPDPNAASLEPTAQEPLSDDPLWDSLPQALLERPTRNLALGRPTSGQGNSRPTLRIYLIIGGGVFALLFAGIVLVAILGRLRRGPAPGQDPETLAATAERHQFEGFAFEVPGGWSRTTPDRSKEKAMLLLGGEPWYTAHGMIKVDAGPPTLPDAAAVANDYAQDMNGQIVSTTVDVDGEQGLRVVGDSTGLSKPREVIVVFRHGKVYLIMAAGVKGANVSNALEHICTTWKWDDG